VKALHLKIYRLQQDLALAKSAEQQLKTSLQQQASAAKEAASAADATARRQFRINKDLEKARDAALGAQQAAEKSNKYVIGMTRGTYLTEGLHQPLAGGTAELPDVD
jgi:hypothetical protein